MSRADAHPALTGAAVAILAGGEARRIGGAKATVELGGRPLIAYPLDAALSAGLDAMVVAKRESELPSLGFDVHREDDARQHPLTGIVAALRLSRGRPVVVVGCDIPFVTAELLSWLAGLPEPLVVPSVGGRLHPLLARYTPALAGDLERALEASAPLTETVDSLEPRLVAEQELARFGDPARLVFNVNSPADLQEAERMLAAGSTTTDAL